MILYFECFSGISGDMSVASLLDLGADKQVLLDALDSLNIDGYKLEIDTSSKCGIFGTSFNVALADGRHPDYIGENDHYHHVSEAVDEDSSKAEEEKDTEVEETQNNKSEKHNHSHHTHRNLADITKIIDESGITENAKTIAKSIFGFIARAEAKAHNKTMNEIHFHEVGAVDSIVDVVSVAVCIDNIGISKIAASTVYEGTGFVQCAHGIMPVPVPAVVNIFQESGLNMRITETRSEMVTPTGAAVLAALVNIDELPNDFKIVKTGIGVGQKDFPNANILRTMLIEETKKKAV